MASRREANREMTCPAFMENLKLLFPELESIPHHDTLMRLLSKIEEVDQKSNEIVTKRGRHAWISSKPLNKGNVHGRCNLAARHRWGIESGILVEKRYGYQYEHCFSYNWKAMRGYHYLMRLGWFSHKLSNGKVNY